MTSPVPSSAVWVGYARLTHFFFDFIEDWPICCDLILLIASFANGATVSRANGIGVYVCVPQAPIAGDFSFPVLAIWPTVPASQEFLSDARQTHGFVAETWRSDCVWELICVCHNVVPLCIAASSAFFVL